MDGKGLRETGLIKKNIRSYYNCEVHELTPILISDELLKKGKDTIRAGSLLRYLRKKFRNSKFDKIIALTEKPLYLSDLNPSIRGLGTKGGKTAVMSTYKIKNESNGDKKFYKSLLMKVSRHEIGHTLGLGHCLNQSECVMTSGVDPEKFYSIKPTLCDSCHNLIQEFVWE